MKILGFVALSVSALGIAGTASAQDFMKEPTYGTIELSEFVEAMTGAPASDAIRRQSALLSC